MQTGLEQVSVALSHPHYFTVGGGSSSLVAVDPPLDFSPFQPFDVQPEEVGSVVQLDSLQALGPGEAASIPIWIRAATTGHTNFRFLFYYQPQVSSYKLTSNKFLLAYVHTVLETELGGQFKW